MGVSFNIQRISTSDMKVLGVTCLVFVCVAARGSGPYLPSGWKPDGPVFYLPSEVLKPVKEPVKEIIFSESEASASDFLREYGPPKVQEVSQDISRQGLPDVVNDLLFIPLTGETSDAKENSKEPTESTEEKFEVKSEIKGTEEPVAFTESVSIVEDETLQLEEETTTLANAVDAINEFGYLEPTVAIVVPAEKVTVEASVETKDRIIKDIFVENQNSTNEQQISSQSIDEGEKSGNTDFIQDTSGSEESSIYENEQATSSDVDILETRTQKTDSDVVSTIEEGLEPIISTVEKKVETVEEEVKKVEEVVQNIPNLIANLGNDVKPQEVETVPVVPATLQEIFGSIDQAPEGFLEYGPPGFTEYGPPREELKDSTTIEGKIAETQPIDNFVRRRRFSPKFRSSRKIQ